MIRKRHNMIFVILSVLLIAEAHGQLSLDDMIQKVKQDNGIVFNLDRFQSAPIHSNQFQSVNPGGPIDSRFDSRLSSLVSQKVLQLAHNVALQASGGNIKSSIISPASIAGALALVLLGANGNTFDELMHLMGFDQDPTLRANPYKIHEEFGLLVEDMLSDYPNPSRPRPLNPWKYMAKTSSLRRNHAPTVNFTNPSQYHLISVANGVFIQSGFSLRPSYQSAVQDIYRSEIVPLDFLTNSQGARKYINDWVKVKTRGKIDQIVGAEISSNTNMIIASALYFKALWEQTFLDGATNKKNFYPDGLAGPPILVDMMAHGGVFPFYDAKEYDCRILGFPYKGNQTTMYIILPNNSNRHRLREIQAHLTPDRIEDMISKMQLKTAIILFPKLHIQNSVDLKGIFRNMGLRSLFEPMQSDLSLVTSDRVQTSANIGKPVSGIVASIQNKPFKVQTTASDRLGLIDSKTESHLSASSNLEDELIFSRFSIHENDTQTPRPAEVNQHHWERRKRSVSYKVESSDRKDSSSLRYKDFLVSKRLLKQTGEKKLFRGRRQLPDLSSGIKQLDQLRNGGGLRNPGIFADAIVHKIDLTINEQGTEGGAATAVYLTRTGTDVVFRVETPFLLLIRHDATRIPLFYGSVYEPTD